MRDIAVRIEIVNVSDDVTVARKIQSCSVLSVRADAIEIREVGLIQSHWQIEKC
jgi:hypothetical protein